MGSYNITFNNTAHTYAIKESGNEVAVDDAHKDKVKAALAEEARENGNNTEFFADKLNLDKHKFWAYLVQANGLAADYKQGLTDEEIAVGLMALDNADGALDGKIDESKLSTTTTPAPTAPTSGGATAPANLNGTVDASNKLTLTKNGDYEAIANYLIGNAAHAAKIAELETKRATYNAANGTNLTQTQYVAKLVRQVTTDAYPNKPEARYPDAKLSIDLNAVLEGTLDKAKDDIQEAKAKKTSGGGKKKVAKKKPVEEVTPPVPVTPETPVAPVEPETPEEPPVADKPSLWDTIVKNKVLIAGVLGLGAVAAWLQDRKQNRTNMPPQQGVAYNGPPPNQNMFGQGVFGGNPFA